MSDRTKKRRLLDEIAEVQNLSELINTDKSDEEIDCPTQNHLESSNVTNIPGPSYRDHLNYEVVPADRQNIILNYSKYLIRYFNLDSLDNK